LSQSSGVPDDSWIFYGDSITLNFANHGDQYDGTQDSISIPENIHDVFFQYFPAVENGGINCAQTSDAVANIESWLSVFPGKYVGLSYGTNDATGNTSPDTFYANYAQLVQKVLGSGKVPIVPKIPWGWDSSLQANGPALNDKIELLYRNFPAIIKGPDFWTFFDQNKDFIDKGDVHPTASGYYQMKKLWVQTMIQSIYKTSPARYPVSIPSPASSPGLLRTPSPVPTPEGIRYYIYHDSLVNGWSDSSDASTVNWSDTQMPYLGSGSISWIANQAWAGLGFENYAPGFDTSGFTTLTFALQATRTNQELAVYINDAAGTTDTMMLSNYGGPPPVGSYRVYNIPLSALNATNKNIHRIIIQEYMGAAEPVVHVDEVGLK
jgi:lysophospholipase L1-like esterase